MNIYSSKKVMLNNVKKSDEYTFHLSRAFNHIQKFIDSGNTSDKDLKVATKELCYCIKLRNTQIEPYLSMSYLFYIMKQNKIANDYFNVAYAIAPSNEIVLKFKSLLSGDLNKENFSPVSELTLDFSEKLRVKKANNLL
ncbi:MAG: hypothetical protein U0354_16765 [Candidatus Sericytochromatia bacterium]